MSSFYRAETGKKMDTVSVVLLHGRNEQEGKKGGGRTRKRRKMEKKKKWHRTRQVDTLGRQRQTQIGVDLLPHVGVLLLWV